jgi:DNA-binding transcriptional LysR family regulator
MTLRQLRIFATVAKLGSFTQAAESLRVRQPSVTLLIQGLEREFGVKLFEKLGNRIRLTGAGEKLLQSAEDVLGELESLKNQMDEIKGLERGRIRIGGSALAAASFLPVAIQKFKKEHPGIEVILKIQRTDDLEEGLLDGELDIAIVSWVLRSTLLVGEPYREEEIVAIAPPKHPLARKRSVSLETLAREPLIAPGKGIRARELLEQKFAQEGIPFVPGIEIAAPFAVRDTIRNAVASGLGIGFVAKCHVLGDIKAGRVRLLKVPKPGWTRILYIAMHKNRQNSSLVRAFRDFLKHDRARP